MAFDERLFEAFAMMADTATKAHPDQSIAMQGISAFYIGDKLGFSNNDAREFANYLKDNAWATLNNIDCGNGPEPFVRLTLLGFREIAKLKRPRIIRWVERHTAITSIVVALATSLIIEFLKRWFWPS